MPLRYTNIKNTSFIHFSSSFILLFYIFFIIFILIIFIIILSSFSSTTIIRASYRVGKGVSIVAYFEKALKRPGMNFYNKLSLKEKQSAKKLQKIHDFTSPETVKSLKENGFVHLQQCVEADLCDDALREINRRLGFGASAESMKARTFLKEKAITNLFNKSIIVTSYRNYLVEAISATI